MNKRLFCLELKKPLLFEITSRDGVPEHLYGTIVNLIFTKSLKESKGETHLSLLEGSLDMKYSQSGPTISVWVESHLNKKNPPLLAFKSYLESVETIPYKLILKTEEDGEPEQVFHRLNKDVTDTLKKLYDEVGIEYELDLDVSYQGNEFSIVGDLPLAKEMLPRIIDEFKSKGYLVELTRALLKEHKPCEKSPS